VRVRQSGEQNATAYLELFSEFKVGDPGSRNCKPQTRVISRFKSSGARRKSVKSCVDDLDPAG
jgi:hypothetical protein